MGRSTHLPPSARRAACRFILRVGDGNVNGRVVVAALALAWVVAAHRSSESQTRRSERRATLAFGALVQLGLGRAADLLTASQVARRQAGSTAAIRAQSLLVHARTAFSRRERSPLSALSARERLAYLAIDSIVDALGVGTDTALAFVADRAPRVARTLPLCGAHPELRELAPVYRRAGNAVEVVRIDGVFPTLPDDAPRPILTVGTAVYSPTVRDGGSLTFEISLAPRRSAGGDASAVVARLAVPWNAGHWYQIGPFRDVAVATYTLTLPRLPPITDRADSAFYRSDSRTHHPVRRPP